MHRIEEIQRILDELYPPPLPIPLDFINDFTFLVAVILSAQSKDGTVNAVTKELFKLAKTPKEMSKLDQVFLEKVISKVGLAKSKAKYLVEASNAILTRFNGNIPNTLEELVNELYCIAFGCSAL